MACHPKSVRSALLSVSALYHGGVSAFLSNILPVWVVTSVGALLVGFVVSVDQRVPSMVAVLAASVVVSFILQVAFYRPDALVSRLSVALTGSVLLTAIAAVVFQVLSVVD